MHAPNTKVGDVPLYVRRWGPPGGPPLIYLHALGPASSAAFLGLAVQPLVDAGWSVAAPDMPGYGASPPVAPDDYSVPALAGLVERLADTLGWEQFVLAGHSWGGAIACHVAAARPDRVAALVLVDSGHLDYADVPGADLASTLEETVAAADANRLRLPDRAAVAALLHTGQRRCVRRCVPGGHGERRPRRLRVPDSRIGRGSGALPPGPRRGRARPGR